MPSYTGNRGVVSIDGNNYCVTSWGFTSSIASLDTTKQAVAGSESRTFLSDGLRNGTASIEFDATDTSELEIVTGDIVVCQLSDELATYHFSAIASSKGHSVTVGGKTSITVDLQITGAIIDILHAYGLTVDDITFDAGTTFDITLGWTPRHDKLATDEQEVWRRVYSGSWGAWAAALGHTGLDYDAISRVVGTDFSGITAVEFAIRVKDTVSGKLSEKSNIVIVYDADLPTYQPKT